MVENYLKEFVGQTHTKYHNEYIKAVNIYNVRNIMSSDDAPTTF